MLIEQKIEIDGQKITITRTVKHPGAANASRPAKPVDVFSKQNPDITDEETAQIASSRPKQKAGGTAQLDVLIPPGGNLEELGPGGDLEDLGPGGNLTTDLTIVFGPVNIECCRCHRNDPLDSQASA